MGFEQIGDIAARVVEKAARGEGIIERHAITDRAAWLMLRLNDVTASDVAAICDRDPYRTPLAVWAEKTGATQGSADNATLRRGRWGEAAVIEMLRDERPSWDIRRAGVYLRDPSIRLGATPDAVATDPDRLGIGCVQCKTVRKDIFERDWEGGDPPLRYQLQALTEGMLIGASWIAVAALIMDAGGGWEPVIREIRRHEEAEARIRAAVIRFWSEIEAGRQPPVNPARDADVVDALFPKAACADPIDLSADNFLPDAIAERARLKGDVKVAEARISEIETDIKAKLGLHESALVPGWRLTWKNEKRRAYAVAASNPRVLRITAKGA